MQFSFGRKFVEIVEFGLVKDEDTLLFQGEFIGNADSFLGVNVFIALSWFYSNSRNIHIIIFPLKIFNLCLNSIKHRIFHFLQIIFLTFLNCIQSILRKIKFIFHLLSKVIILHVVFNGFFDIQCQVVHSHQAT